MEVVGFSFPDWGANFLPAIVFFLIKIVCVCVSSSSSFLFPFFFFPFLFSSPLVPRWLFSKQKNQQNRGKRFRRFPERGLRGADAQEAGPQKTSNVNCSGGLMTRGP